MEQVEDVELLYHHGHVLSPLGSHVAVRGKNRDMDAIALAQSGKKQVLEVSMSNLSLRYTAHGLKRRFGLVSMTGFSCGLMCTWEGMLVFVSHIISF